MRKPSHWQAPGARILSEMDEQPEERARESGLNLVLCFRGAGVRAILFSPVAPPASRSSHRRPLRPDSSEVLARRGSQLHTTVVSNGQGLAWREWHGGRETRSKPEVYGRRTRAGRVHPVRTAQPTQTARRHAAPGRKCGGCAPDCRSPQSGCPLRARGRGVGRSHSERWQDDFHQC